LRAVTQRFKEG